MNKIAYILVIGLFISIELILPTKSAIALKPYIEQSSFNNAKTNEITNLELKVGLVIHNKKFLSEFKSAPYYKQFRVVIKLNNEDQLKPDLTLFGTNIRPFFSYNGLAISSTKLQILDLISRNIVKEVWNNSVFSIQGNLFANITHNSSQGISDYNLMIKAQELWNKNISGDNVKIAILDTGIIPNHPALNVTLSNERRILATYNFFNNDSFPLDDNGHGTAIAGIIGSNGKFGYPKGIAPNCKLLIGKILSNSGEGTLETLLSGIDWAIKNNADIINLSLGRTVEELSPPEVEAVNNAIRQGTIVVVAAGNSAQKALFNYNLQHTIYSPGISSMAITVGAVDNNSIIYEHSSGGPVTINFDSKKGSYLYNLFPASEMWLKPDVVAPGVRITSITNKMGQTKVVSGTSYSAAVVSGAVALLKSAYPAYSPSVIKASLLNSSRHLYISTTSPLGDKLNVSVPVVYQGAGLIDLVAALNYLVMPPPIEIWPKNIGTMIKSMFLNDKNTIIVQLFVNQPLTSLSFSISDSLKNIVNINKAVSIDTVSQYDIKITLSSYSSSIGWHKGNISFIINKQKVFSLSSNINVVNALGKVLIDINNLGINDNYSLFGDLSSFREELQKNHLIPYILPNENGDTINNLNLNDFEDIIIINSLTSINESSYHTNGYNRLVDYITSGGNYSGGAMAIFPTLLSNLSFLNNLSAHYGIAVSELNLDYEVLALLNNYQPLINFPNKISKLYIPRPLLVEGSNNTVRNVMNHFAYSDNRYLKGSMFAVFNSIEMFLDSPYLYNDLTDTYNIIKLSNFFGDNRNFLRNVISTISPPISYVKVALPSQEFSDHDIIKFNISVFNPYKGISGWPLFVTLKNSNTNREYTFTNITDCENGSYLVYIDLKLYDIPAGPYELNVRSPSSTVFYLVNITTNVSIVPRFVELPMVICIVYLIVVKIKKNNKIK